MPRLKVFRTTIGFHDAYIAAPSRAAALRAWGSNTDLFAMGAAEEVVDKALMAKPLADPGTILKQPRGSAADHMAAASVNPGRKRQTKIVAARIPPRPSRSKLDDADAQLAAAEADYDHVKAEYELEDASIAKRRRAERRKHELKIAHLREARDAADAAFRQEVDQWRKGQVSDA